MVAVPASLSARSLPFTPACPGQYIQVTLFSLIRWSGSHHLELLIPAFTFCSKLMESVAITAHVLWLTSLVASQWRACVTTLTCIIKLAVLCLYAMLFDSISLAGLMFCD